MDHEYYQKKQVVAWAAWFVSLDSQQPSILRFNSENHKIEELPEDGFLCAKTRLADGYYENVYGNGWLVVQNTTAGLLFQSSGDNNKPDTSRYIGAKFIKDKLAPSALYHVADWECQQWL